MRQWLPNLPNARGNKAAYGFRSGAWRPRKAEAVANVWHTTGAGIIRRYNLKPDKYGSTFGAALWVFRNMKAGPHIVIGQHAGEVAQVAPLDVVAWHVGRRKSRPYFRGDGQPHSKRYAWWHSRWNSSGIFSPTDLAGGLLWRGQQCNPNTYGIEIVPPADDPRGPWSPECWENIRHVQRELLIPLDPFHQLGHSDAHPIARTARGDGWDPSPDAWDPWRHCMALIKTSGEYFGASR